MDLSTLASLLRDCASRSTLAPMRRPLFAFVLSFLLLGMQQEVLQHPLTHLGDLTHKREQSLKTPQASETCAECQLLASGTNVVASTIAAVPVALAAADVARVRFVTRSAAAPSYYSSRAPPAFL